nr:MAG TPA: hypothetical protein [Caudoviricetes sp.]
MASALLSGLPNFIFLSPYYSHSDFKLSNYS